MPIKEIGEKIHQNEVLGKIGDQDIQAPVDGQIWGILHSGHLVEKNEKIALILENQFRGEFREIGVIENMIACGALEAVLQMNALC